MKQTAFKLAVHMFPC